MRLTYEGKFVDLHVHTTFSDSSFSPAEVMKVAAAARLNVVAITDHDTVLGIEPARSAGHERGVEVISGVELTTCFREAETHVLGLLIDERSPALVAKLTEFSAARRERVFEIARRLEALGVSIDPEEVLELGGMGTVGRAHVAELMVRAGHGRNISQVFDSYIGQGASAYVPKPHFPGEAAVDLIHSAGGVAVLAHPGEEVDEEKVAHFAEIGADGLEVYYPAYEAALRRRYLELAERCDLVPAGGSDDHGRFKDRLLLGSIQLPGELLDRLVERAARWR